MPALNAHRLTTAARIALAKERTEKVVDHVRAAIQLHETNAIVVYSPTMSDQIPRSYAAHAFNQFQSSLHLFEIVRLCALWDGADQDKENVPTILELIDDADVLAALTAESQARWLAGRPPSDHAWGNKQATREIQLLDGTIAKARAVEASPRLVSLLNIRHKRLAHSLISTSYERKGTVDPLKYGDERWLFEETLAIVDGLHITINGAGFMWDDARQMARRNAAALWKNCTFNVTS
jgi:hypothetical protein